MNFWMRKNIGVLNPWIQVMLWWAFMITGIPFGGLSAAVLNELITWKPSPPGTYTYLAGSAALLVALLCYWRRYWFLTSDLEKLLDARGGTMFQKMFQISSHWFDPIVKAHVGDLLILACFDHPILGYSPSRGFDLKMKDLMQSPRKWNLQPHTWKKRGGFNPRYMLSVSHVNLFRLGDFSRLPRIHFPVTKEWGSESLTSWTNGPILDSALRSAVRTLIDPGLILTVEIREKWLRIEVKGGTWLGLIFGQRISQALDFTECLVSGLATHFTPLEHDQWTVDFDDTDFVVRPTVNSGLTSDSDRRNRQRGTISEFAISNSALESQCRDFKI